MELPRTLLAGCIEVYTKADLLDAEARRQWLDALEEEPPDGGALLVLTLTLTLTLRRALTP